MNSTGTLYIVGTPIGNLEDITLRAIRVLKEVALIAVEDTRRTSILLRHYQISTPMVSYHRFNEARRTPELLEILRSGRSIALVSDAGMPTVSDPGGYLIEAVINANLPLDIIPGPTAATAGLAIAGLKSHEFYFVGFLPRKSGALRKKLSQLANESATLIFYESPYRVGKALSAIAEVLGPRRVVLVRELTKKFQEVIRGSASEIATALTNRRLKGECTIFVEGKST